MRLKNYEKHERRKNEKPKEKTLLCKVLAAVLCFAMIFSAIAPVTTQAASKVELALKYKGKTVVIEKLDADDMELDVTTGCHQASYTKIKKSFGAARKYEGNGGTAYEYKDTGFLFTLEPWDGSDMYSLTIEITSAKAALNGVKVGMSYSQAKKKLEKNYGKSRVITQDDKAAIMLTFTDCFPKPCTCISPCIFAVHFFLFFILISILPPSAGGTDRNGSDSHFQIFV